MPHPSDAGSAKGMPRLGRAKATMLAILYSGVVIYGGAIVLIIGVLLAAISLNLFYSLVQTDNGLLPPIELFEQWMGVSPGSVSIFEGYFVNLFSNLVGVAFILGTTWFLCRRVHNISLSDLGLSWLPRTDRSIVFFLTLGVAVACLRTLPLATQSIVIRNHPDLTAYLSALAFLVITGLMGAVGEEIAFRGYILQLLERSWGAGIALVLTSVAFALAHLEGDHFEVRRAVIIFVFGLMLGYVFLQTRILWCSIAIHFGWNLGAAITDISINRLLVDGPELLSTINVGWGPAVVRMILASACAGIALVWVRRARRSHSLNQ